jgi:hypothetical protein
MKRAIVITSIFNPTEAVCAFSQMPDYQVYVVGDRKTPADWHCRNVDYISVTEQEKSDYRLAKILPYNHYCRKMLGYLKAIQNGAEYIVDADDDNIPKHDWDFPEFEQKYECISGIRGFVNIYNLYTDQKIAPRGLPLNLNPLPYELEKYLSWKDCRVGVWQGLADENPDVDALYRLKNDAPCYFRDRSPVVLGEGTICPFNTQNTMIRKELFALMYLPAFVTFRFTDILRGLISQPIMWLYGYHLGFTGATVVQKRNPHNYMKDLMSEIPMYEHGEKVAELASSAISKSENAGNNLYNAYHALLQANIVCAEEMITLESWLEDLEKLKS